MTKPMFYDYTGTATFADEACKAGFELIYTGGSAPERAPGGDVLPRVLVADNELMVADLAEDALIAACHIDGRGWRKLLDQSVERAVRLRISAGGSLPTLAVERQPRHVIEINILRKLGTMTASDWRKVLKAVATYDLARRIVDDDAAVEPAVRQYFRPPTREITNALVVLCQGYLAAWVAATGTAPPEEGSALDQLAREVTESGVFAKLDLSSLRSAHHHFAEAQLSSWWNVFDKTGAAAFDRLKEQLRIEASEKQGQSLSAAEELLDLVGRGRKVEDPALVWRAFRTLSAGFQGGSPRNPTNG